MPVSLYQEQIGTAVLLRVEGRLDAHGAAEIGPALTSVSPSHIVVVDAGALTYLSSAGIRILVELHKAQLAQGGRLLIAGLQPYCRAVLKVAGLEQILSVFETVDAALSESGVASEERSTAVGRFVFQNGSDAPGEIEVLGEGDDVLRAAITPEKMRTKSFSAKAYSLGLGGLGPGVAEVLPVMGEMMTLGGTMVWRPTDGHDTPDFLVPQRESEEVAIHTGFNVSFSGQFNEYIEFEATAREGVTLAALYRELFTLAKARRPDYCGALALAMRAEIGQVFGGGVKRAPIATRAPKNGRLITDPTNYEAWFDKDDSPRHRDVTGLICGLGVDLEADLSKLNPEPLNAAFSLDAGKDEVVAREKLHNHGVFFQPYPLGEKPWNLEREIRNVIDGGAFLDMRHLFDETTILWALIGVVYVQDFIRDTEG